MKEAFREVKRELVILAALSVAFAVIFRIIYYRESTLTVIRTLAAVFWLFIIPGYAVMLNWKKELGLAERIVVGSALSAGMVGIISYYTGVAGIQISVHWLLIPIILIILGIGWAMLKNNVQEKTENEKMN